MRWCGEHIVFNKSNHCVFRESLLKQHNKKECIVFSCLAPQLLCASCAYCSRVSLAQALPEYEYRPFKKSIDPLKVFLGSIHAHLFKPHVAEWLEKYGHVKWLNIYMVPNRDGRGNVETQCCFVTFDTTDEAYALTQMNGTADGRITPTVISASHIVPQHGSFRSF